MMHPHLRHTSRHAREKRKIPPCREFNSASNGACFVKKFLLVLVLQHGKENELKISLKNLDKANLEFELSAAYPNDCKKLSKFWYILQSQDNNSWQDNESNHNPFAKSWLKTLKKQVLKSDSEKQDQQSIFHQLLFKTLIGALKHLRSDKLLLHAYLARITRLGAQSKG